MRASRVRQWSSDRSVADAVLSSAGWVALAPLYPAARPSSEEATRSATGTPEPAAAQAPENSARVRAEEDVHKPPGAGDHCQTSAMTDDKSTIRFLLRAYTPAGVGCLLRQPPLLPFAVQLKGRLIPNSNQFQVA